MGSMWRWCGLSEQARLTRDIAIATPAVAGEGARATQIELLGHAEYSYPAKVRAAVLAAMNAEQASVADLARLNFLLGELYADAVLATQRAISREGGTGRLPRADSLPSGEAQTFLGRKIAATWQTGEAR